eukprot:SAG31_NODE_858_length_11437_cov_38.887049_6_plen_28_part_01
MDVRAVRFASPTFDEVRAASMNPYDVLG